MTIKEIYKKLDAIADKYHTQIAEDFDRFIEW